MSLRTLARSIPAVVRRDYLLTTVVHWLTLASGLLLFHLVARRASVAGFAYYQVARGVVSTLHPIALIGLVPALHRYLPRAGDRTRALAGQAFLVQVVVMDVVGLLGLVLSDDVGRLLGIGGVPAVRAVVLLAAGMCLITVAAAALRGSGQARLSNLLWLVGVGVVPLVAFAVTTRIDVFLAIQGAAMAAVAVLGIALVRRHPTLRPDPPTLRTLLVYGLRRAPGEIALPAMFAFPTFYVAGALPGGPEAGYIGFATSAVTLICSVFGMLTPVLLPRLSAHFQAAPPSAAPADPPPTAPADPPPTAAGPPPAGPPPAGPPPGAHKSDLSRGLRLLPLAAGALACVAVVLLLWSAPALVHNFLGDEFTDAIAVLRAAIPAAIPFAAFYAARPALDAVQDRPVIARLQLVCLGVQLIVTYAAGAVLPAAPAAILGMTVAAAALGAFAYTALLRAVPA
ncbi:oligosaccharide flippase family protein [Paractinoplanes rishiriensis]|uniref:O-antigen/teichoic acid export membrane protein n=1 Tax=Paractinoplanes rishiriensis TaxID=1050105 RepID=A0A919K287_9ACTN|nr:oligosaccharide flippase family protein [Actinoplanes rishiriensis]GIE97308.1 hypothetical protein Ari01nite_47730 [Actinoplanes rishiriensis]